MSLLAMVVLVLVLLNGVQASTNPVCPNVYNCVGVGQTCGNVGRTNNACDSSSSESYYYNITSREQTCTCVPQTTPTSTPAPTQAPLVLGGTCDAATGYWNGHRCTTDALHGVTVSRWFSYKRIGDVCSSATNFDCLPPRQCVNGKCAGNLAVGSVCYNATSGGGTSALGLCTIGAICEYYNQVTGFQQSVATCIPRRTAGQSCNYNNGNRPVCADGLDCLQGADYSHFYCGREAKYFVADGAHANSSVQCISGIRNNTDGTCLGYSYLLGLVNAKVGKACSADSDCGNSPWTYDTLSYCQCNDMGTQNMAACSAYSEPTPAALIASNTAAIATATNFYSAGCETNNELASRPTDTITNNWCYRFTASSGGFDLVAYCKAIKAEIASGVKDCSGFYTVACGALHTMTMSMTLMAALMLVSIVLGTN